jgi:hypothetical protein
MIDSLLLVGLTVSALQFDSLPLASELDRFPPRSYIQEALRINAEFGAQCATWQTWDPEWVAIKRTNDQIGWIWYSLDCAHEQNGHYRRIELHAARAFMGPELWHRPAFLPVVPWWMLRK